MTDGEDVLNDGQTSLSGAGVEPDLEHEIADALGDLSVLDMVDPPAAPADLAGGQQALRRGRVVSVQGDDILVDLGGKSTGVLPIKQLGGEPLPAEGDTIEVMVTGYNEEEGLLNLSRQDAVMAATWDTLEVGQNVEGRVTGHNKGGLELTIDGIKAFMPISQVDRFRVEELAGYVNQRLACRVSEIRRNEKTIVVSRRAVLEEQAASAREERFNALVEGEQVTGTVKTIMPYGAFVDVGGVDGLLHVGDMSYTRIADPRTVVSEGQQLTVQILKIDRESRKIGLGLKQILADPWDMAETQWPPDDIVSGRITRLMDFGAFCELTPGVEGLIPIGEFTFERRIGHPREMVKEGEVVKVRVLSVDCQRRRISLSLKRVGEDPWQGASVRWAPESVVEGTVKRITDFGAFVELVAGVEGLVHISEMSDSHLRSAAEMLQVGQQIQAKVLGVDEERRRISLSIKQAAAVTDWEAHAAAAEQPPPDKGKRKKPLRGGLDR